jgi:hypothetical protein
MVNRENRAQAMSLEAILASFLLVTALTVSLGILVINDGSLGENNNTFNQSEHHESVSSALQVSAELGELKQTLLYWNNTEERFHNTTTENYYTTKNPPTELGKSINKTIKPGYKSNIYLIYKEDTNNDGNYEKQEQTLVNQGDPTENAVAVYYTTTIHDSDKLYKANGKKSSDTISDVTFYAPDISSGTTYNTVTIKVVVWEEK